MHEGVLDTLRNAGLLLAKRVGMDYVMTNKGFVSIWVYSEEEVRALAEGLKRVSEQYPTEKMTSSLVPILDQMQRAVENLDNERATA